MPETKKETNKETNKETVYVLPVHSFQTIQRCAEPRQSDKQQREQHRIKTPPRPWVESFPPVYYVQRQCLYRRPLKLAAQATGAQRSLFIYVRAGATAHMLVSLHYKARVQAQVTARALTLLLSLPTATAVQGIFRDRLHSCPTALCHVRALSASSCIHACRPSTHILHACPQTLAPCSTEPFTH